MAITPLIVLIAAIEACGRSDSAAGTHGTAASGATASGVDEDKWMNRWHKEAYDGQDSRTLWDKFSQAARGELGKPGADPSDLTAKANALGADPEKVFEFIRDQITLEPYAGVLRGARGTLMAGAGNALDRALLAKELLRLNGVDSRLVTGRLSDAQTDTLLARFLSSSQVPKILADLIATPNEAAIKEQAAGVAATFGIPEKAAADLTDHIRDEAQAFWTKTDAQSATQFDSLDSRLRRTSLKMAVDAGALTAKLKERLGQHYWLQVREPKGNWTDFDAAFADPQRGTAHGSHALALSDPPDSLYHKLAFTLVYQTVSDGAPKEDTVVAGTYASADAQFESVQFRIQPTDLGDPNALLAMDAKTKRETLRSLKRYQGLLVAGRKVTAGRKFDFEGNTYDPTSGPASLKPAGTFADALGGAESAVRFAELRVIMRLTGPGREPLIQRRTLVRGSDIASGTFAPPIISWEILLQPQWIPSEFVGFRALTQVLAMGDALVKATEGDRSLANLPVPNSAPPIVLQVALLRETAVARILANATGVRGFIDQPMLTIASHQIAGINDSAAKVTGYRRFDIVDNGIRYVPTGDTGGAVAFDAALRQGVTDCTLEDRVLRENFSPAAITSGMTIVEQANLEKRAVLLAKTQDIDALRSTGVTEADIDWIHDNELPDSRLVVATTSSGSDAWWSVQPNGTTVLRTNGGGGQAETEYIEASEVMTIVACELEVFDALKQKVTKGEVENESLFDAISCAFIWGAGAGVKAGIGIFVQGAHAAHEAENIASVFFIALDIITHFATKEVPSPAGA